MEKAFEIENIKNFLHSLYRGNNPHEAFTFFDNLIDSESDCPVLFNILIEIIIQDNDINLKNVSLTIIRKMNFNFIIDSIFILNQRIDPAYTYIIEMLTNFLTKEIQFELFSLIDEKISTYQDFNDQKAILQLLSSFNDNIYTEKIKIDKINNEMYNEIQNKYYRYFIQTAGSLISNDELDANGTAFLLYFARSFQKILTILDFDFFHTLACFCLSQATDDKMHADLIETIIMIYSGLLRKYKEDNLKVSSIHEFLKYFYEYCQSIDNIPTESLYFWRYFFIRLDTIDPIPDNFEDLILYCIFPFFKFNPDLVDHNLELFIYELSPDIDSPLYALISGLRLTPEYPRLSEFIFQFADSYFEQYYEQDIFEICRLLIIVSTFSFSPCSINQNYICSFYQEKIFPLIDQIDIYQVKIVDIYLAIAICAFISKANPINDKPIFDDPSYSQVLIEFLKWALLYQLDDDNTNLLLFYYSFQVISNRFKKLNTLQLILLFNFDEEEIQKILENIIKINSKVQTLYTNELWMFLIDKLMTPDIIEVTIESLVECIWEFCLSFNDTDNTDTFLRGKYLDLFSLLVSKCDNYDEKANIFNEVFTKLTDEMEKSNWILDPYCFEYTLNLMIVFTDNLLISSDKIPQIMETIGWFIYTMLFSIDSSFPCIYDLVFQYSCFILKIIQYTTDPDEFIKSIAPFLMQIVTKFNEILPEDETFTFEGLNAPLIKFKGIGSIFQFFYDIHSNLLEMEKLDNSAKSEFLTALIISNPSFLFEHENKILDIIQNVFPNSLAILHINAILEILIYFYDNRPSSEDLEAVVSSFLQRIEELNELLTNHKFNEEKNNDEEEDANFAYIEDVNFACTCDDDLDDVDDDERPYFDYQIFTENIFNTISRVMDLIKLFGIEL